MELREKLIFTASLILPILFTCFIGALSYKIFLSWEYDADLTVLFLERHLIWIIISVSCFLLSWTVILLSLYSYELEYLFLKNTYFNILLGISYGSLWMTQREIKVGIATTIFPPFDGWGILILIIIVSIGLLYFLIKISERYLNTKFSTPDYIYGAPADDKSLKNEEIVLSNRQGAEDVIPIGTNNENHNPLESEIDHDQAAQVLSIQKIRTSASNQYFIEFPNDLRIALCKYIFQEESARPKATSEIVRELIAQLSKVLENALNYYNEQNQENAQLSDLNLSQIEEMSKPYLDDLFALEHTPGVLGELFNLRTKKNITSFRNGILRLVRTLGEEKDLTTRYLERLGAISHEVLHHIQRQEPINIVQLNQAVLFTEFNLSFNQVRKIATALVELSGQPIQLFDSVYSKDNSGNNVYFKIARTFSLLPEGQPSLDIYFKKYRDYQNQICKTFYARLMSEELFSELKQCRAHQSELFSGKIKKNEYRSLINSFDLYRYFSGKYPKSYIYDKGDESLELKNLIPKTYPDTEFHERIQRCAVRQVYDPFCNWIVRTEHLYQLCKMFPDFIDEPIDPNWRQPNMPNSETFLQEQYFRNERLSNLRKVLQYTIFGNSSLYSTAYINNLLSQVRNLYFKRADFKLSTLSQSQSTLQEFIRGQIEAMRQSDDSHNLNQLANFSEFEDYVFEDFKRKRKGNYETIPRAELLDYLKDSYIRRLKYKTANLVRYALKLRKKLSKEKSKENSDPHTAQVLTSLETKIERLSGVSQPYNTLKEFKQLRDDPNGTINSLKQQIVTNLEQNPYDLDSLLINALGTEITSYLDYASVQPKEDFYVLKRLYTPVLYGFEFDTPSESEFEEFLQHQFLLKTRIHFKSLFFTPLKSNPVQTNLISIIKQEIFQLKDQLYQALSIPQFKQQSANLINKNVFQGEYCTPEGSFANIAFEIEGRKKLWIKCKIHDSKQVKINNIVYHGRLEALIKGEGAIPQMPVVSFKDGKLLLSQPFIVTKKSCSKPSQNQTKEVRMGVDLGLKDFATLSIKAQGQEIARHFLNEKIFDYNFEKGSFVWKNPNQTQLTNIKYRLIRIRRTIRETSRKIKRYESYFIRKYPQWEKILFNTPLIEVKQRQGVLFDRISNLSNFQTKYFERYCQRKIFLSRLWERVQQINTEIANLVAHNLVEIAKHYRVSHIKFEDLRWAKNSRTQNAGNYLAYWQVHWFYSRIQSITEGLSSRAGIKVLAVDPRNTSKNCEVCGEKGSRTSKGFRCTNKHCAKYGITVDADLNAARNIVRR
ncbi:MAG: transposase, partial [Candidatus Lokiarchaeota archaeon]|nr:transposase [Candidatus Lokiarchaeota archaeon]